MTAPAAPALAKAKLYPLTTVDNGNAKKLPRVTFNEKDAIVVQFNPTSLKIQYTNESTGGETTKAQARQSPVQGHSTLSFDLEFDTAEGDKSGQPLDVRTLTSKVLAFARPPAKPADPPPRVRFAWGAIIFNGIVNSITEDIDYFDADGHALRAKLSLSIKEQNLKFEANASGPPAKSAKAASKPGESARAGGPGSQPSKDPTRTESAQAGESVQQVLSRLNALPEQWRSAMTGLDSPLDLAAGTPIQLGAAASAAAGAEVSAAFGAAASITAGAAVSGGVGAAAEVSAGFALSASGGVVAAAGAVASEEAAAGLATARAQFSIPAGQVGFGGSAAVDTDRRSLTYGRSVPLQARAEAVTVAGARVGGSVSLSARAAPGELRVSASGASAPWQQLPAGPARAAVDAAQRSRDDRPSTMRWSPGR